MSGAVARRGLALRRGGTDVMVLAGDLDRVRVRSAMRDWVSKRDTSVRLPWERAVHTVGGIGYLRSEVALLLKARADRPKDPGRPRRGEVCPEIGFCG